MNRQSSSQAALKRLLKSDSQVRTDSKEARFQELLDQYHQGPSAKIKRGRGRPKKNESDKVQVISLKMPPKLIRFLDELILPHPKARGRGGKIRYMMVHFVKMKKREIAQLKVLVSQLKIFDRELSKLDPKKRHDLKEMKNLQEIISSLRAIVDLYKIEMKDYKRTLKDEDYRLLELALSFGDRFH